MTWSLSRTATVVASLAAVILGGCSGGGGGSPVPLPNGATSNVATSAPVVTAAPSVMSAPTVLTAPSATAPAATSASATPAPVVTKSPTPVAATPTPAASAAPLSIAGTILNHDTNAPIANAVVYVSHTIVTGATAPMAAPTDGAEVVTAANGTYTLTLPRQAAYPVRFYLEVFTPGMVTVHDVLTVLTPAQTTAPTYSETVLSADEAAWLALINVDRAKWNAPPVVADETTEEVARLWVAFLATGYFEHACSAGDVACPDKMSYEAQHGADFVDSGESIGEGFDTFAAVEAAFVAEQANCPQPTVVATCPYSEATGHFLNVVNPNVYWFGVAESFNGVIFDDPTNRANYYDEELANEDVSGATIHDRARDAFRSAVPR